MPDCAIATKFRKCALNKPRGSPFSALQVEWHARHRAIYCRPPQELLCHFVACLRSTRYETPRFAPSPDAEKTPVGTYLSRSASPPYNDFPCPDRERGTIP